MKVRWVRALPFSIMFSRHSIDYFPQPLFSKFLISLMCLFRYSFRKLCELLVCLDVTKGAKISSEVWDCIIRKDTGRRKYARNSDKRKEGYHHYHHHHHHHHHHHMSVMELGHLLTRSGLTYLEIFSEVCHDTFCQLGTDNAAICGRPSHDSRHRR